MFRKSGALDGYWVMVDVFISISIWWQRWVVSSIVLTGCGVVADLINAKIQAIWT